jgi:hypothetical protein
MERKMVEGFTDPKPEAVELVHKQAETKAIPPALAPVH